MSSKVVVFRHMVEACKKAVSKAKELSGRLAEQGIVSDLGFLCQSGGSVPSYFCSKGV